MSEGLVTRESALAAISCFLPAPARKVSEARGKLQAAPLDEVVPPGVMQAIIAAGFTLLKTERGYHLLKIDMPIVAQAKPALRQVSSAPSGYISRLPRGSSVAMFPSADGDGVCIDFRDTRDQLTRLALSEQALAAVAAMCPLFLKGGASC